MADLKTDLAECVRLAKLATPGKWRVAQAQNATRTWPEVLAPGYTPVATPYTDKDANAAAITALHNLFHDHGDELLAAVEDAERWRWLAGSQNCSLSVSHNDHHNMYLTVEDTMDEPQGYYADVDAAERERMIATDTIWTVHVYPNTPIGFNVYHGATLNAAIDAAMRVVAGNGGGDGG